MLYLLLAEVQIAPLVSYKGRLTLVPAHPPSPHLPAIVLAKTCLARASIVHPDVVPYNWLKQLYRAEYQSH